MTVIEAILRGVQSLPLRQQVEVARYVHRLNANLANERDTMLGSTHGALDESDGEAFEQAMNDARRLETNG
jgi:hypothetical protein